MHTILSGIKTGSCNLIKNSVRAMGLPLGVQAWVIKRLPFDYWRKSVAYQQCLADCIAKRYGAVIQAGPFKGMKYITDAEEGCIIPKFLGCYEEELNAAIEGFIAKGYDRVVDVGCASGYYVAGLSLRLPNAETFAFDTDEGPRKRCAQVISLNKLDSRVKLGGLCAPADLESLIRGRTLLVIDCEGAEYELLDPALVPSLRQCDMIVELHDFINPRITPALNERFKDTHSIEKISSRKRIPSAESYPGLTALPEKHWSAALDERRPGVMDWFLMRANRNAD